jgi:hypothetical protein
VGASTRLFGARLDNPQPQSMPVLVNHPAQSAAPINSWSSALFGVPFMAAGIAIGLVALDVISVRKHAPDWLIGFFGALFFFAGLFFFVHGLRDVARKAAWRHEAAQRPNEPWLYDFDWHVEGIVFSAFDDMVKQLVAALIWTGILVPFAWVGTDVQGAWPFLVAVGIFGFCGLVLWFRWGMTLLDLLRFGNSYLRYESFPFSPGGTLRAHLRAPQQVCAIDELTLTLRCVQEKYVTTGSGKNRSANVACYELYKDVSTFNRDLLTGLAGGDIPVEFRLPYDEPVTTLAARPPVYWEIEAKGKAGGVDYRASFLVPVYKAS